MNERKAGEPFQPCLLRDGAVIPEAILKDPTLSTSARIIWGMLAAYQGKNSECSPLEETLAVDLGVKVRQLQSYLKELANYTRGDPPEAFPLLAVKRVWVEKDHKTRNCYSLLWQPLLEMDLQQATKRAHLANGGNAQSVAHRSGENAQNTHPVPPEIPSEEGGVVPAGMPSSDTQHPAHRSQSDTQDTAAKRPAVPGEDGDAVLDGKPTGETPYSAHQSRGDPQDAAPERPGISRDYDGTVADGRPPSDAQYPAHRSAGNPQDTAGKRPVSLRDDDGTVAGGRTPGDTQSLAHRSQGDQPDTGRPAISREDGGTVPDTPQPGGGGAHVIRTPSHELRRPLTQPLKPVPPRYAERPLGPGDCMRNSFPGKCSKCGATVKEPHLLIRVRSGVFCERCCPACHLGHEIQRGM